MISANHQRVEDSEMFSLFESIADTCWDRVDKWQWLAKWTVGRQLVRAADAIGANIAEGAGRFGQADSIHFFVIARASARETQFWLKRCSRRRLIAAPEVKKLLTDLNKAATLLNGLITYRRKNSPSAVREELAVYQADSEFSVDGISEEAWAQIRAEIERVPQEATQ